MLRKSLLFVSLVIFWIILNGGLNYRQLLSAIICSGITVVLTDQFLIRLGIKPVRLPSVWRILWFVAIVLKEIFKGAYNHILRILTREDGAKIFKIYLEVQDEFAIAMIANAITLTPGTITLGMDNNKLTVVGYAKNREEVKAIKQTILTEFQKPFL